MNELHLPTPTARPAPLSRREFLLRGTAVVTTAYAIGCLATGSGAADLARKLCPGPSRPAPVVTARGRDAAALLDGAFRRLGVLTPGQCAGKRVLLKPTLAWRRPPEAGANVAPEVLGATIRAILAARAERVVICDRTAGRADRVYFESGAARVVEEIGDRRVELRVLTAEDFVPLPIEGTELASAAPGGGWRVLRQLLEADVVVNLAAARVHPTWRVALALANLVGLVGGARGDAHWRERGDLELAALGAIVRPELTILDATRPVVRHGPAGRGARDTERRDTLIVSRDPLAVEAAGARLFGLSPDDLPWIRHAVDLGLGSPELTRRREIKT